MSRRILLSLNCTVHSALSYLEHIGDSLYSHFDALSWKRNRAYSSILYHTKTSASIEWLNSWQSLLCSLFLIQISETRYWILPFPPMHYWSSAVSAASDFSTSNFNYFLLQRNSCAFRAQNLSSVNFPLPFLHDLFDSFLMLLRSHTSKSTNSGVHLRLE